MVASILQLDKKLAAWPACARQLEDWRGAAPHKDNVDVGWTLIMVVASLAAAPSQQPAISISISLPEAVARAENSHPWVRQALAQVGSQAAERLRASMWLQTNPEIIAGLGHRHDSSTSRPPST